MNKVALHLDGDWEGAFRLELAPAAPEELGRIHHNLALLGQGDRPMAESVLVFLLTAIGVWATDKAIRRHTAADGWTRRLQLTVPAGTLGEQVAALVSPVNFLTGDLWTLAGRPEPIPDLAPLRATSDWQPTAVCLFSGGLDSLAGAIDLLETGHRCLLVSHYDYGQLAGCQKTLAQALANFYGSERVRRWGFRIQFEAPELSLRSRSLLFLALGLAAASVWSAKPPLIVPENGWISLNPPLTPNRLGSYSTRTTHPYFLQALEGLWLGWGIEQIKYNPYQFLTKGQILAQSRNPHLLQQLLPYTWSCAHPVASRWRKGGQGNCGYCYPCLVRRAALHRVGLDRPWEYLYDVLRQPEVLAHRSRGADLRSLLWALQQKEYERFPERWLWLSGPVPEVHLERLRGMILAGRQELRRWLASGGAFLCLGE